MRKCANAKTFEAADWCEIKWIITVMGKRNNVE